MVEKRVRECDICHREDGLSRFEVLADGKTYILDLCGTHQKPLTKLLTTGTLRPASGKARSFDKYSELIDLTEEP